MPPKAAKGAPGGAPVKTSLLDDTFPPWSDSPTVDKEGSEKYEDFAGTTLPPETQQYLDAWKRPEELVQNMPNLPIVATKQVAPPADAKDAKGAKGAPPPVSRQLEGSLWAGHKSFEWMQAVFTAVMSTSKVIKPGEYLWELIYPKDPKDGTHIKPPNGKYRIKLFIMDQWRTVTIDDRIPVDLFGRPLLVGTRPLQLWPLLLSKAILKVMSAMRITDLELPHQVAAFCALTGWPQEDLLDKLAGPKLEGGFLFDRLEDSVRGNAALMERRAVATVCLKKRAVPEKPPPRIIVITGPSAVGCSRLMRKLVEEYPDKFGLTVSHTTRRPKAHEVHGVDYFFTDKAGMQAQVATGNMLEWAPVTKTQPRHKGRKDDPEAYLYGTSISTVREVAATGKLCVMGMDEQGVVQLQANKRIDGLYLYLRPPSLEELEQRARGRLREADATIQKRLAWAADQVAQATQPGAFEHLVQNTDFDAVYYALKEAISTLSPIIRNRLRGLPAYVLDYSDLIPPNLVEKPFLKPVLLGGPTTGERKKLMELLVREFPDVFAFPRPTTTRPADEDARFQLSGAELDEQTRAAAMRSEKHTAGGLHLPPPTPASPMRGMSPSKLGGGQGGAKEAEEGVVEECIPEEEQEAPVDYPEPQTVSAADFEEMMARGQLLEYHADLFQHAMVTHRTGYTMDAIKEVIKSGRLPLIEVEAEGVAQFKSKGVDLLSVFLQPPTEDAYKERLIAALTESDEEIAARMDVAAKQIEAAGKGRTFDVTLINDDLDATYAELKEVISKVRPDIIMPEAERLALEAAASAGSGQKPQAVLVLTGPARCGRESLAAALCATFPDTFAVPAMLTDRKPGKGEAPSDGLGFVSGKELAKMGTDGLLVLTRPGDGGGKDAGNVAITLEALNAVLKANKVAVIELPVAAVAAALPVLKANQHTAGGLYAFVASPAAAAAAEPAAPGAPPAPDAAALAAAATEARESGQYQLVLGEGSGVELVSAARGALSAHVPEVVPPPHRPLIVAGPFGTGKRVLLRRLFDTLPGKFAAPRMTTTKETTHPEVDERGEMVVVSQEAAAKLVDDGAFLVHQTVLGHTYGIERSAVKRVQATGKVCVVELDRVEDARRLRAEGFDATFIYLGVDSMDELVRRVHAEVASNPPLGYEPDEAAALFFATAKAEVQASREDGLFDEWVDNSSDAAASFGRLSEAVHHHYPTVVVAHFVYGYGRGLWDPTVRSHGKHPLRVMVLGPAAAGKTVVCESLAVRFGLPHINVGDLLFQEVAKKTALGLEAKEFMDASKTVPDKYFLDMLQRRLVEPDCIASGWLLDGFPHTAEQAQALADLGLVPDKVVFLTAEHAVLLDRTKYRRVDMDTGKTYHMSDGSEALSAPITPVTKDGAPDTEVLARLHPRHDDSEENVLARLALWDEHEDALRAAYETISLRVPADTGGLPEEAVESAAEFMALESHVTDIEVVDSWTLKELQYEVVDTLRYRRRPLLRVAQEDGKTFWVDAREVAHNAYCLLLAREPGQFSTVQVLRRLDVTTVPRTALLYVDSEEPSKILVTLALGPQSALEDRPPVPRKILAVCGPSGVGKTTAVDLLLADAPTRLARVVPITTRPMRKGETEQWPFLFTTDDGIREMHAAGQLASNVVASHDGYQYALALEALQAVWDSGRMPVVEAPLELAVAMRVAAGPPPAPPTPAPPITPPAGSTRTGAEAAAAPAAAVPVAPASTTIGVECVYLTADIATLDVRMRDVGNLEEQELQHQISLAKHEMANVEASAAAFRVSKAAAQAAAAKSAAPPPAPAAAGGPAAAKAAAEAAAAAHAAAAAAAASLAAASIAPPEVPDHVLSNMERGPLYLLHEIKHVAAALWHKPRVPVPCQLLLEDYDWRSPVPGPTRKRLRTVHASGTTLELPRGKHLLRITAATEYLHMLTFYVAPPCEGYECVARELSQVLPMDEEAGATVANFEGEYAAPPAPGTCTALLRYNLRVSQPTTFAATLAVSTEEVRATTRFSLIDNEEGLEMVAPSARIYPMELQPTERGYTLLAITSTPAAAKARAPDDTGGAGTWFLQLISSAPLATATETSVVRTQVVEGDYKPNSRCILARQMLTPIQALQTAAVSQTTPPLPIKLSVHQAPTGGEVVWGTDYPLLASHTGDGSALLSNLSLGPGKYLVQLELDPSGCPEGWQPDPITGEIYRPGSQRPLLVNGAGTGGASSSDSGLKWKLIFLPSVDDKVCPITADESQKRYFNKLLDTWGEAGVPVPPGGAAPAGKGAAKAPPPPKGQAPAAGGARAVAAAQLLERVLAEMAGGTPSSAPSPAPAAPSPTPGAVPSAAGVPALTTLTRTAKDGSIIQLTPDSHLHTIPPQGQPALLGAEEVAERIAATQAATQASAGVAGVIGEGLVASQELRKGLATRKPTEFSDWRRSALQGHADLMRARVDALKVAKEALVAAKESAAAEEAAKPPAPPAAGKK